MTSKKTSNDFRLLYLLLTVVILFDPKLYITLRKNWTVSPAVFFITTITALHEAITDASWGQALSQRTSMTMATYVPPFRMLVCSHAIISHAGMYPAHVVRNFSINSRSICSCAAITIACHSHERPALVVFLKLNQFIGQK